MSLMKIYLSKSTIKLLTTTNLLSEGTFMKAFFVKNALPLRKLKRKITKRFNFRIAYQTINH